MNRDAKLAAVQGIARLYNTAEFKAFRAYLGYLTGDAVEFAIKTDEHPEVAKGRARALMELAEFVNTAPQQEQRLETRNGTQKQSKP